MYSKKVWISTQSGKMKGINSISTSCLVNARCIARAKDSKSICHYCYAERYLNMRSALNKHLLENTETLNNHILYDSELPILNTDPFRFESFGDIASDTQLINYINIASKNNNITCAIWTKNMDILYDVFVKMGYEKPSNLIVIVSSVYVNKVVNIPSELMPYVDHVFTVYTKEYAEKHNIIINCGSKKCMTCLLCYGKNDTFEINELKK